MYKKLSIALTIALLLTAGWGYSQYRVNVLNNSLMENSYQSAFYNLVNDMKSLSLLTAKNNIAYSDAQNSRLLAEVRMTANNALENLSVLPLQHYTLSRTEKFLNQIGDYANTLCGEIAIGNPLTREQRKGLEELSKQTSYLQQEIAKLEEQMTEQKLSFRDKVSLLANSPKSGQEKSQKSLWNTTFTSMNQQMSDYPTLIYAGAYSDHMENLQPKQLEGEEISKEEALEIIEKLPVLHDDIQYDFSDPIEVGTDSAVPIYSIIITGTEKDYPINVDISKTGGKIVTMLNNRPVTENNMSQEDAIARAKEFLKSQGYENLEITYTLKEDNILQLEFANKDNDIYCYGDRVKVKIALDNGEVLGFESKDFLMNHCDRKFEKPKLSETEAKAKLNPNVQIESSRLVMMPNASGEEVLCYEFNSQYNGQNYLIYINAENGNEEDILQVFTDDNGSWTL